MSLNRNIAYTIRKFMPDIEFVHNKLGNNKLNGFRKMLLSKEVVDAGEKSPESINAIINKLSESRSQQINRLISFYDKYLKTWGISLNKDEYETRKNQMLFDCMAYGFSPDEFHYYDLINKTPEEKKCYVTDLDRKMMQYQLSDFKDLQYVFDKTATYEKFSGFYKRDAISVSSKKDFDAFCNFTKHHDEMVIKMVSASSGHGVSIECVDRNRLKGQFEKIIANGKCSIEERIQQSDILGRFNPASVNTARIMTFNTSHGIVVGPCFFRTGKAGSYVDNGGSGGIMIGLDGKSGVLNSDGYDEYPRVYTEHPDSKIVFKGFQLPDWNGCIELVHEMARMIPRVGYVGWDMAYTKNKGWVIVEANGGSHIMTQLLYGKGCKEEIEGYMKDMKHYGR